MKMKDPHLALESLKRKEKELHYEIASAEVDTLLEMFSSNDYMSYYRRRKAQEKLDSLETDRYLATAQSLAIEIPTNKPDWWEKGKDFEDPNKERDYLTPLGKIGIAALIKKAKRDNVEWWIKIVSGILVGLTGLAGTIIGIIALLRR